MLSRSYAERLAQGAAERLSPDGLDAAGDVLQAREIYLHARPGWSGGWPKVEHGEPAGVAGGPEEKERSGVGDGLVPVEVEPWPGVPHLPVGIAGKPAPVKVTVEVERGSKRRETIAGRAAKLTDDDCSTIQISDNGPGVSEDLSQKIFVPFFTTKPEGSGVGLALSRQVMTAHGGFIRVSDNEGGGAKFTLTF